MQTELISKITNQQVEGLGLRSRIQNLSLFTYSFKGPQKQESKNDFTNQIELGKLTIDG